MYRGNAIIGVGAPLIFIEGIMKYVAVAVLAALASAGGANAQDYSSLLRYSLDNGLDVVLLPDHRVPKVVVDISYRVGAMNEPPGRSGFAHLFEHLMFAGTPAYPSIDVAYGAVGVSINASTWDDRTMYYAQGMSSVLPLMLSIEADRMANQGEAIGQKDLDVQRDVVLNEMRQNVLDAVKETGYEALRTSLFPAPHPYNRAVIGSMPDLEAATIEDVHAFFDTYYVPNNATLVVNGDFDVDRVRRLIDETFGKIPRGADVPRPVPTPVDPAHVWLEVEDKVPTPTILLGWAIPPLQDPDPGYLRVPLELLINPDYGVLRQKLVDTGLASTVTGWIEPGYLGGRFVLTVNSAEGTDPAALEAAARSAVAEFVAGEVTSEAVEREKRKIILADRAGNERMLTLADNILIFTEVANDPRLATDDDPYVVASTPDTAMSVSRRYLDPVDASVVVIMPGDRGGYPDVLTTSSGTSVALDTPARPTVDIPKLQPDEAVAASAPVRETATLSNGIKVIHYPIPTAALNYLMAVSEAGTLSAPEGSEGIIELASTVAVRGARGLAPADFGRAIKDLGGEISSQADPHATALTLSIPPENLGAGVALFADAVRAPDFNEHEWEVQKAATLDELGLREGDLDDVAIRYGEWALFPKRPGKGAIDRSIASVEKLQLTDAKALFGQLFNPGNVTLYSVGSAKLDDVVAALERELGDWASTLPPLPDEGQLTTSFPAKPRVLLVPEPGASQASIFVAVPAPGYDDPHRAESEAVFNLLTYDFISRINSVVREEKGYSYGTGGALYGGVRKGSIMTVEAPVERDTVGPALEEIVKGFASLVSDPPHPDEIQRTVIGSYADIAEASETAQGLFDELWNQLAVGSTIEEEHDFRLQVIGLKLPDVQAQAKALAPLDHALILVVGDPDVVRPQLEGLGYSVEAVERKL
jgi:predicted Zn-dependent peptidase